MATSSISSALGNTTGTLNSAGIGSGLDVESIVTQLMAVEQQPLAQLQERAEKVQTTLSEVGKLQSHFSALQDKSRALTSLTLWNSASATSADTSAVTASTSGSAAAGSYAVQVNRLATAQNLTSSALSSSSATLSAGSLTIELGRYGSGEPPSFTAQEGASAVTIDIGDGETSLQAIRDKINRADAGVVASIITDASGARLTLRSADTGAQNAFRVSVSETLDDAEAGSGLSMLAWDASSSASSAMTRSASAGDADLTINGVAVSSASNKLDQVMDGLSINLLKVTSSEVTVTVAADTAAVKTAITDFVSAFNTLAGYIRTATAYNADSKTGGPLQGDQGTLALQSSLRGVLNEGSSASSTWSTLSQIGITIGSDGKLSTSTSLLDNALGNLGELRKLLTADGDDDASTGFIRRFQGLADSVLSTGGTLDSRKTSLQSSLDRNGKSQDAMELRLANTEARLRAQYQSLDTQMAKLNNLSSYVSSMFSS